MEGDSLPDLDQRNNNSSLNFIVSDLLPGSKARGLNGFPDQGLALTGPPSLLRVPETNPNSRTLVSTEPLNQVSMVRYMLSMCMSERVECYV